MRTFEPLARQRPQSWRPRSLDQLRSQPSLDDRAAGRGGLWTA